MSFGISPENSRDEPLWLPALEIRVTGEGRVEADVFLDPSSPWFAGHFDGLPLLPGVALLALAGETLGRFAQERGYHVEMTGFSKVRFKRFVVPGETLSISVGAFPPGPGQDLDFIVRVEGELAARGRMQVELAKMTPDLIAE